MNLNFAPSADEFFDFSLKSNTQQLSTQVNGWFFLHFLVSFNSNQFGYFKKSYNLKIDPVDMIETDWYKIHINENTYSKLKKSEKVEIFSVKEYRRYLRNSPKTIHSLTKYDDYLVTAVENWKPKKEFIHFFGNYFCVKNTTLNELYDDEDVFDAIPNPKRSVANRFVGGFIQSGKDEIVIQDGQIIVKRVLQEKGLNGNGVVVNIVDTGVDVNHAFFYDKNTKAPFNETNLKHRKIVRYDSVFDEKDSFGGHGTHVAGIVAGESYDPNAGAAAYNGVAPKSKIYFVDLGDASRDGDLSAEMDMNVLMDTMVELNSPISSNSWSFSANYDDVTQIYTQAGYLYPNILQVFAVGNDDADMFVCSPSDSTNVLTVGWTTRPESSSIEEKREILLTNGKIEIQIVDSYDLYKTDGPILTNLELSTTFEAGKAVLYEGTNSKEASNEAKRVGAKMIIYSKDNSFYFPSARVSAQDFETLKGWTTVSVIYQPFTESTSSVYINPKSSRGPSYYGISKPDVVVPGTNTRSALGMGIYSVPSEPLFENLHLMSGSSMATPAVSGLLAVATQYFREGFYPTLTKNDANKISNFPASLLRAVIINSAKPIKGSTYTPDFKQGFGCPALADGLGFGLYGVRFLVSETIESGGHHMFKINTKRASLFSVTLSYIDMATKLKIHMLYEDLDLVVVTPSGRIMNGNDVNGDPTTANERVVDVKGEIGEYQIHIFSKPNYANDDTTYSLAIKGGFDTEDETSNPSNMQRVKPVCINNCGQGTCDEQTGKCNCPLTSTGTYCQIPVEDIELGKEYTIDLIPRETKWYYLKKKEDLNFLTFQLKQPKNIRFCAVKPHYPISNTNGGKGCLFFEDYKGFDIGQMKNIKSDLFLGLIPIYPKSLSVTFNLTMENSDSSNEEGQPTDSNEEESSSQITEGNEGISTENESENNNNNMESGKTKSYTTMEIALIALIVFLAIIFCVLIGLVIKYFMMTRADKSNDESLSNEIPSA